MKVDDFVGHSSANQRVSKMLAENGSARLERLPWERRRQIERDYSKDPKGTDALLRERGFTHVANQLKIDLAMGRLQ